MIDFSFLISWVKFPLAELSHALQGVLAGWLAARAIFHKEVSDALIALLITANFSIYETLEMVRIKDSGDLDLENYWLSAIANWCNLYLHSLLEAAENEIK